METNGKSGRFRGDLNRSETGRLVVKVLEFILPPEPGTYFIWDVAAYPR